MVGRLDKQAYNESNLIEIKIPLQMPYSTDKSDFERYDGSVEFNGIHYNYVKRKVSNDTLFLLCIPNEKETQIVNAKNEYANLVSDMQTSSNNKKSADNSLLLKLITTEYNQQTQDYSFSSLYFLQQYFLERNNVQLPSCFIAGPLQPPDITA